MKIILIGKAGSGKDTVADYLALAYGFYGYAFADKLKQIVQELFPHEWATNKRQTLQKVGALMRAIREDVWVEYVLGVVDDERTVITVPDAKYQQCTGCGRTTFEPEEGLRLLALAKQAHEGGE